MHIEPGVVDGAKLGLAFGTAAASAGLIAKLALDTIRRDGGVLALAGRSLAATMAVFVFFEMMPHFAVGVSEVHFILGSTLFLILGAGPAAIGLAAGLLIQGVFFAPADLPQYAMNVTTLIVPLWGIYEIAKRIIPAGTAYVDVTYAQALALSTAYQGGIVAWVAFWALYGHGFGVETLTAVGTFGAAYMTVVILEPLADLGVLALAKWATRGRTTAILPTRLYRAAA